MHAMPCTLCVRIRPCGCACCATCVLPPGFREVEDASQRCPQGFGVPCSKFRACRRALPRHALGSVSQIPILSFEPCHGRQRVSLTLGPRVYSPARVWLCRPPLDLQISGISDSMSCGHASRPGEPCVKRRGVSLTLGPRVYSPARVWLCRPPLDLQISGISDPMSCGHASRPGEPCVKRRGVSLTLGPRVYSPARACSDLWDK